MQIESVFNEHLMTLWVAEALKWPEKLPFELLLELKFIISRRIRIVFDLTKNDMKNEMPKSIHIYTIKAPLF